MLIGKIVLRTKVFVPWRGFEPVLPTRQASDLRFRKLFNCAKYYYLNKLFLIKFLPDEDLKYFSLLIAFSRVRYFSK